MKVVLADDVQHGWVRFETDNRLRLSELPDPQRKTYAAVFCASEHAPNWGEKFETANDQDLALHLARVVVGGSEEGTAAEISLPMAGLRGAEISARKEAMIRKLLD